MNKEQRKENKGQTTKNSEQTARSKESVNADCNGGKRGKKTGRALDVFVVLFCLSGMAVSLYLFQNDLFRSLRFLNVTQAGIVTIKYNTVQRRFHDRMIWDRLTNESPVYDGDLIRIARHSGAMLNIDDNHIELSESTLIRIQTGGGSLLIDFFSGRINVASSDSGSVFLSIGDRVVEADPGTAFDVSMGGDGLMLRVTDGTARIVQGDQVVEVPAGSAIVQDAQGNETFQPAASVIQPKPNARFLKNASDVLNVVFNWTRINMKNDDRLLLEVARDSNFSQVIRTVGNLDTRASVPVNSGIWHWRLSLDGNTLSAGRFTVTEAPPPSALTPQEGAVFYARASAPEVQLRWTAVQDAVYYNLQISSAPDFSNIHTSLDVQGTSHVVSNLEAGRWYWRVLPVFPPIYEGERSFSEVSYFRIENGDAHAPLSLSSPLPETTIVTGDGKDLYFSWMGVKEAVTYTFLISGNSDLSNPLLSDTTRNNFYIVRKEKIDLVPGRYFWSVFYTDSEGNASAMPAARSFITAENVIVQKLISPPDRFNIEDNDKGKVLFTWETNLTYDVRFQVSASPDFSILEINAPVTSDSITGISAVPGEWYWRITARPDARAVSVPSSSRRFTVEPSRLVLVEMPAPQQPRLQTGLRPQPAARTQPQLQISALPSVRPPPLRIALLSPERGTTVPGLTALREAVVFRWAPLDDVEIESSRFVLSRNANPAAGRPDIEIRGPEREIVINRLAEGVWYWTVEGVSTDGRQAASEEPGRLHVLAIPFLPSPENRLPENGHTIGIEELRLQRNIVFKWSEVEGANAYILTISREGVPGQRIYQSEPLSELTYTFDNLLLLDNHDIIYWHVEALFYDNEGRIEQRGQVFDFTIALNVPRPGRVRARDMGIIYGTE